MRYATQRKIQNAIMIGMLAGCYLLAATESHAQACPLVGGLYQADIPYQDGDCELLILDDTDLGPVFEQGTLYCPDASSPSGVRTSSVAVLYKPSPQGCYVDLEFRTGSLMVPEDAPETYEAAYAGWIGAGISSPQVACLSSTAHWMSGAPDPSSIRSVNITEGTGNVLRIFQCEGDQWIDIGNGPELRPVGPIGDFEIRVIPGDPVYQRGNAFYDADDAVLDPISGVISAPDAEMSTQRASGENLTWEAAPMVFLPCAAPAVDCPSEQ